MELLVGKLEYFILILFRTATFMMNLPVLGQSLRSQEYKAAFSILLALVIFPVVVDPTWQAPEEMLAYVVLIAKECFVGIFLAFVVSLTFSAVRMTGDIVGMEMGLNLAAQVDPLTGSNTPLIAYFFEVMATLIFLSLNFHHWVLAGLSESFQVLPVGMLNIVNLDMEVILSLFTQLLKASLVLAAPIFIVMAMLSLSMGLISKAVPNFNILDAGYTLRVGVAILAMFIFIPGFLDAVAGLFEGMRSSLFAAMKSLT